MRKIHSWLVPTLTYYRYLHFQVVPCAEPDSVDPPGSAPLPLPASARALRPADKVSPAQWINCDIRSFDFSVLGQ